MRVAVVFSVGILLASVSFAAPLAVTQLRCEYLDSPLGIDVVQPRLSWILESGERGAHQTAYQVLVASSPELLVQDEGDRWDSGKVMSGQSVHVAYGGAPLASGQACHWKVRVWNGAGERSAWSAPAHWSMGLLAESDWKGTWIGVTGGALGPRPVVDALRAAHWVWYPEGEPAQSAPVAERCFRTVFDIPDPAAVRQIRAYYTADNFARLVFNGNDAGEIRTYHAVKDVDLAPWLRAGKNTVAITAGNAGVNPNPAGLLAVVEIKFEDGTEELVGGDQTWKSAPAPEAGWETAAFDDTGWVPAKDLGPFGSDPWGGVGMVDQRVLPARMLRKEFALASRPVKATAYVAGLGAFVFHVNGQRVGDEVLAPGLTEYNKRVFYRTFDVTSLLQDGGNALGVELGNGRYYAPRSVAPTHTRGYGLPSLRLQLALEHVDGSVERIVSDESWQATSDGPITENNEYDGERYDARKEMPGWNTAGFDASAWRAADTMDPPGGVLAAQMAEPIRVTQTMPPIAMNEPKPGLFIYDMGQNMVGWCRLKVSGPAGTAVQLRFAETLRDDGTLYLDNIRGAKVTDVYTLKGEGEETWAPQFVFHGFRYVELTGYPGTPALDTLLGEVVHDDMADAGAFACSNPLLNQLYQNIRWGVRGNYRSIPTDCPQRDERQGWLGDRSAECTGESYLYDVAAFYAKWVTDMEDAQREDGSVSDVCPSYWPLYNDNVTWPSTFIIAPHMLCTQYGDTRAFERHYGGMRRWINHMKKYLQDGLMPRDSYGDWCVPPEEEHLIHSQDENRKTPGEVLGTAYFIHDLNLMTQYAEMLGKPGDAADYRALARLMTDAFNAKYWHAEEGYYANGSQTAQILPLYFGIAPPEAEGPAFDHLVNRIMVEGKGHIGTGLVGGQWLMRTLSDRGRADVAYTIATQTDYPSWGYMLAHDATTIWELWNGNTADPAMNSHNHVMLVGDLCTWFHEYLAGIAPDPEQPGFKHIVMKPHVVGDLTSASAIHRSPYGEIRSAWRLEGGGFTWDVTVPPNTAATVHVLSEDGAVREGGAPVASAQGLRVLRTEDGRVVLAVQPGAYRFTSK